MPLRSPHDAPLQASSSPAPRRRGPRALVVAAWLAAGCGTVGGVPTDPPDASDASAEAGEIPDAASIDQSSPDAADAPAQPLDGGPDARDARGCTKPADCPSSVCVLATGVCAPAACGDLTKNQDETDIDCGGAVCPACGSFRKCVLASDCQSGVCTGSVCQPPSCTDGVTNGAETGTDCGGGLCAKCADGQPCGDAADCQSDVCVAGVCAKDTCSDGAKNGTDTDVDCGGAACPRCEVGLMCLTDADCVSDSCADRGMGLRCQPPSCADGEQNGAETDVDCGGPSCSPCVRGARCLVGADCVSGGCNFASVCSAGRSCTAHYGGNTCGTGGVGGVGPELWEDCCVSSPVTLPSGATAQVDKYPVTSGRMRAFLTSIGYNVRGFVASARAAGAIPTLPSDPTVPVLAPQWDRYLPTSFGGDSNFGELSGCAERDCLPLGSSSCTCQPGTSFRGIYTAASRHIGGFIFQGNAQSQTGCFVGGPGTHSFRFPNGAQDGPPPEAAQDIYDTKAMNCVDYLVGQAFCVWDGGRLATAEEWRAAWGPGPLPWSATDPRVPVAPQDRGLPLGRGDQTYWGCRFPWATDASHPSCALTWDPTQRSIELAAYQFTYEYPKLVASDYIVFLPIPGRTRGRGPSGHSDLVGGMLEMTSDVTFNASPYEARHGWTGGGSWDAGPYDPASSFATMLLNKTSRLGLRCARP
ncbi:MAG TPA: hypothetical protein PK141_27260 [Polyangiaceae bacterium]|nr:hypothetical protein [Polyangiaceae bacterium]